VNRRMRREIKRTSGFDLPGGHIVTVATTYVCDTCGEGCLHVEMFELGDEPDGLPAEMWFCDECGGLRRATDQVLS